MAYGVAIAYHDFSAALPDLNNSYYFSFGTYPNASPGPITVGDDVTIRSVSNTDWYMFGYVNSSVGTTSTTIVYNITVTGLSEILHGASVVDETYWSIDSTVSIDVPLPSDESLSMSDASASLTVRPKIAYHKGLIMAKSAVFNTDPYFVVAGYPIAASGFGVNIYSKGTIDMNGVETNVKYSDVDLYSDERWVPIDSTLGISTQGANTYLTKWWPWKSNVANSVLASSTNSPTVVNNVQVNYGYGTQNTRLNEKAVRFLNDQYLVTNNKPLTTVNNQSKYFTMMSVIFLQPPTKSNWYVVMGAGGDKYTSFDPLISVRYYRNSTLKLMLGHTVLSEIRIDASRFQMFKPIVIAVSVSATDKIVRFAVLDTQFHYEQVAIAANHPFDVNFYLGGAPVTDKNYTAHMYLLEHNQYYSELSQEQIQDRMLLLDKIYGVTL